MRRPLQVTNEHVFDDFLRNIETLDDRLLTAAVMTGGALVRCRLSLYEVFWRRVALDEFEQTKTSIKL